MFSSVARSATPMDSKTLHMRSSSKASRPRRSARTTQTLGEAAGASVTDERTTTRSLLQRDGSRDAIVLVMLKDQNTRLGTQTARQGGALIADGMAVTLLIGGDAGVGGDVANGIGQDDLQRKGS